MGVITAEVPQSKVEKEDAGPDRYHGHLSKEKYDDAFDAALDDVSGMWAYRKESTEEIAKTLRRAWSASSGI